MQQRRPRSSSDRRSAKAAIVSLWQVFLMFAALLGEPAPAEHPLRLFVFADRKWFAEYAHAAMLVIPPGLDGFYLRETPSKIVVGMPNPYLRLAQPDRLLRVLFGYYLLNCF